jgi:hypothetical protein
LTFGLLTKIVIARFGQLANSDVGKTVINVDVDVLTDTLIWDTTQSQTM